VVDWGHVRSLVQNFDTPNYLNFVRPYELVDIVARNFSLERKKLVRSSAERGGRRLTPAILTALPRYFREELETESVLLWARREEQTEALPILGEAVQHGVELRLAWAVLEQGHCFITRLPSIATLTDLILFEDGRALGPSGAMHNDIRSNGGGRYSVWGNYLYFSTSDNSDPMTNGRAYLLQNKRRQTRPNG
jgi:hypothetical protein